MARQLIVELIGKSDKLTSTLNEAGQQTKSFGDKLKTGSRRAGMGAVALGAGLTRLSGPLEDSRLRLETMAGNVGITGEEFKDLDSQLNSTRRAMQISGHTTAETNESMAKLISATGDAEESTRLLALADNFAAASGRDLQSSTEEVLKIMGGSGSRTLRQFGIDIKTTEDPLSALEEKLDGTSSRLEATFRGRMQAATVIVKDFAASLGEKLGPALTALGPFLIALPTLIGGVRTALTFLATHPFFLAIMVGGAIILALIMLETKFGLISDAINALKSAFGEVTGFLLDGLAQIVEGFANMADGISNIPGMGWLKGVADDMRGFAADTRRAADGWRELGNEVKGVVDPLKNIKALGPILPGVNPATNINAYGPALPRHHTGGMVPGPAGSPTPILALGGERVVQGGGGGGGVNIYVSGVGMGRDFGKAVADALRDNQLIGVT